MLSITQNVVNLTQLVWTMHKNMQGLGFKPRPPPKKKKCFEFENNLKRNHQISIFFCFQRRQGFFAFSNEDHNQSLL